MNSKHRIHHRAEYIGVRFPVHEVNASKCMGVDMTDYARSIVEDLGKEGCRVVPSCVPINAEAVERM